MALLSSLYVSTVEGQNILSPTSMSSEGMNVSAAISASSIPRARIIPIVLTREKLQSMSEPNPIMTEIPDVMMDSPAQMMDSLRASL